MTLLSPGLKDIADKWFDIYEAKRIEGDINMVSAEVSRLVGGIDIHMAIILNYMRMKYYIEKKKTKYTYYVSPKICQRSINVWSVD